MGLMKMLWIGGKLLVRVFFRDAVTASPEGAAVNSQGRKPLGDMAGSRASPGGAAVASVAPSGLKRP